MTFCVVIAAPDQYFSPDGWWNNREGRKTFVIEWMKTVAEMVGNMKRSLRFLWPYLWRYRRGFALGFASLAMKDLLGAALPLAMRAAIDALTAAASCGWWSAFCGVMILISAIKGLFQYWMRVILIGISRDVEYDLRNDLFARLVTLDAEFYGRMRTGDILARATNDMNAVRMMLGPGVMYLVRNVDDAGAVGRRDAVGGLASDAGGAGAGAAGEPSR